MHQIPNPTPPTCANQGESRGPLIRSVSAGFAYAGLSNATGYRKLDKRCRQYDPTFPLPISVGLTSKAFIRAELDAWIASRAAARTSAEMPQ